MKLAKYTFYILTLVLLGCSVCDLDRKVTFDYGGKTLVIEPQDIKSKVVCSMVKRIEKIDEKIAQTVDDPNADAAKIEQHRKDRDKAVEDLDRFMNAKDPDPNITEESIKKQLDNIEKNMSS